MPRRWNIAILLAATLAGSLFLWCGDMFLHVPCIFKGVTYVPCPGCGLTRAALALTRGDLGGALRLNPLSVLVWAWVATSWVWIAVDVVRGSDTYWPLYRRRWARWAMWAAVAVIAANWAWSIYKGL